MSQGNHAHRPTTYRQILAAEERGKAAALRELGARPPPPPPYNGAGYGRAFLQAIRSQVFSPPRASSQETREQHNARRSKERMNSRVKRLHKQLEEARAALLTCCVCYNAFDDGERKLTVLGPCDHAVCALCARKLNANETTRKCPTCRGVMTGMWKIHT